VLLLSMKPGATLVLPGEGVTLTVLEVRRARVRLGISAPDGVPLRPLEVCQRLSQQVPTRAGVRSERARVERETSR
jgi:sRNA-binding carbon storage regulator CsrA